MNLKVRRFAKKPNELMLLDKDTKSFIVAENTTKPVGRR